MIPQTVVTLLVELTRAGIQLQPHGDGLRYRPRSAVTPKLARRMQTQKADLLALLRTIPRSQAARLIRDTRRAGKHDFAVYLRDIWEERVAICTIDGGLTIQDAEAIALEELEKRLNFKISP